MGIIELFFLSIGLAMDVFAVSICKGLAMKNVTLENCIICGMWFGGFQAMMPVIGYFLGSGFKEYIEEFSPWIAFILLAIIGINMIREAFQEDKMNIEKCAAVDGKTMTFMAIATSVDALVIGITFACVPLQIVSVNGMVNLLIGVSIIGAVSFALACAGVKLGNLFGSRYSCKAEAFGGIILLLIGFKILLEHI